MCAVFTPVGWESDDRNFVWATPSWTRPDHMGHELRLNRETGFVTCSCEASVYGNLGSNLLDPHTGCKHSRFLKAALLQSLGRGEGV